MIDKESGTSNEFLTIFPEKTSTCDTSATENIPRDLIHNREDGFTQHD